MKSSPFAPRTSVRQAAFTLVEMCVALAIAVGVSLTAFQALRSGLWLSSQNLGINVSALRGRTVIDQIGARSRYAIEQPLLINNDGTLAAGTTADGIVIKRLLGDPYVVKDASGGTTDIASTATQFTVEYRANLPVPQVGDYILLESVSRPQLEITAVTTMTATSTVQRRLLTVGTAVGETLSPSAVRIGGQLFRKEAYLFVNTETTSNPHAQLQHYERVKSSTVFSTASNYVVMANDYRRLSGGTYFVSGTSNSATYVTVQALCNSSTRQETVARNNAVSTFTTIPVQLRLWSVNR